jgi:hypothetical protein
MSKLWNELLIEMVEKAPPYNEPLPLSNRKETIWGTTIPLLVGHTDIPVLWVPIG